MTNMTFTIEIPDNTKNVKVSVLCDGKRIHCDNSRYRPGNWNGLHGGTLYGQYFDMEDVNRVSEMTEIATALAEKGVRYGLSKLKRKYRITISKTDYFNMENELRERIYAINCFHDRLQNQ